MLPAVTLAALAVAPGALPDPVAPKHYLLERVTVGYLTSTFELAESHVGVADRGSGIQLALTRIAQNPPTTVPFSVNLQGGRNVQSRAREDATPQNIDRVGFGPPPPGMQLGLFFNEIYLVNVTSTSPNGATAEIEAKLARLQAGTGAQ